MLDLPMAKNNAAKNDAVLLSRTRVATPCRADWNAMVGDDRSRFCGGCRKNVYNLSAMTATEAANLIREKEGKLCVRYYERTDGTVLTQDCPIGVAAVKRKVARVFAAGIVGFAALFSAATQWWMTDTGNLFAERFHALAERISPTAPSSEVIYEEQVLGGISFSPTVESSPEPVEATMGAPEPMMGEVAPSVRTATLGAVITDEQPAVMGKPRLSAPNGHAKKRSK